MNYKRGASGEWIMFISIDSFYRNKTSVAHVLNGFWRNMQCCSCCSVGNWYAGEHQDWFDLDNQRLWKVLVHLLLNQISPIHSPTIFFLTANKSPLFGWSLIKYLKYFIGVGRINIIFYSSMHFTSKWKASQNYCFSSLLLINY